MSKCVYKGVKFVQNNASKSIIGVKDCNSVFHFSADKILSDSELLDLVKKEYKEDKENE